MRKVITREQRQKIRQANRMLKRGLKWRQIGPQLGYDNWKDLYNELYLITTKDNEGNLVPVA